MTQTKPCPKCTNKAIKVQCNGGLADYPPEAWRCECGYFEHIYPDWMTPGEKKKEKFWDKWKAAQGEGE